jgi:hypothetical protein
VGCSTPSHGTSLGLRSVWREALPSPQWCVVRHFDNSVIKVPDESEIADAEVEPRKDTTLNHTTPTSPSRPAAVIGDRTLLDVDEMTRLYVDEGLTQKEVADILGTSQQTVGRRLLKLGIDAHSHPCRSIELAPIPNGVNDEDRRKLDYIRGEVIDQKHGEREQADIDLLCDTYRDVLRRYARLEVVSGRP